MSSHPTTSRVWTLAEPPTGPITSSTFSLETQDLPELKDGQVLVQPTHLSNDPAQRTWMDGDTDPRRLYAPPILKGQSVTAGGIAKVIKSKSSKWKEGQEVSGTFGWYEYAVVDESQIQSEAIKIPGQSPVISLSFLGGIGLTAYFGVFDVCKLEKDSVVVVSGAAGAVGSTVVQIAKKVVGCKKVIGIAGGKEKCDWVKSLGADECVDYKSSSYAKDLKDLLPDYADVYFDNVGGEILDVMLPLVKRYGKIAVCGSIANYNGEPMKLKNWREVIYNRLHIQGLIIFDYLDRAGQAISDLSGWIKDGKIETTGGEMIVDTKFEDIPATWQMLFEGGNKGKLITKLQ
ncbi:hypothetical protein FFLO_03217 [Filobasidium floriforme]|uniref:Enoyl reductase (ER) domain-containing protein n=1 Tax=Filobasidium floriforme TaxID=5210 RepID=A0A8K0JLG5_9TREE|nr:hypothetical protein FFLO_03217 [Filobasidium floriforme]